MTTGKLPLIPVDKANHFIYGCLIYFIAQIWLVPVYALSVVILIGVLKELYDKISGKGTPDIMDSIWTILGAIPLFLIQIM